MKTKKKKAKKLQTQINETRNRKKLEEIRGSRNRYFELNPVEEKEENDLKDE